jgi:CHAD domain-containing protein
VPWGGASARVGREGPPGPDVYHSRVARIRELLAAQLDELESRDALADDPEELHKVRVATRRSRAIIRAARSIWGDRLDEMANELRWLAGLLGPVRDLDVLIEHLRLEAQSLDGDGRAAEAIVAAFEAERGADRAALAEALASERYQALLAGFRAAVADLPDGEGDLRPLADKQLRKLRQAAKDLPDDPPDEDLHALRIRAKRARYTAELAGGKRRDRRAGLLKQLQDVIGEHQDAVVAEQRLRKVARAKTAVVAGRLIERERVRRAARREAYPEVLRSVLRD